MSKTQHVYALFDTPEAAAAAQASLMARGCSNEHCSAILHESSIDTSVLPNAERASAEAARDGALVGGATGVVLAGVVTLGSGLLGAGPLAAMVVAGGVMAAYGAAIGGITASDTPEKHMRALEAEIENGKVLVAVETDDAELEEVCEIVFEQHGGQKIVF